MTCKLNLPLSEIMHFKNSLLILCAPWLPPITRIVNLSRSNPRKPNALFLSILVNSFLIGLPVKTIFFLLTVRYFFESIKEMAILSQNLAKNLLALPQTTFCSCTNVFTLNNQEHITKGTLIKLPKPTTTLGLKSLIINIA